LFFLSFIVVTVQALDNDAWLNKARSLVEEGFMMDSDETPEEGFYCIIMTEIVPVSSGSELDAAVLEGKRKITAFVHGETVSASTKLDVKSETLSEGDETVKKSYRKFEKKIKTKVNALVKCIKVVGQVSVKEKSYLVCMTCEKFEDQTEALQKAQAEYGEEGVVVSVGEANNHDIALQKAIRGAVEQVLGTVVVGYDKLGTKKDFQSQVFSGTNGVVETYRILSEVEVSHGTRVEIVAKVSKQNLLDNYANYMKFLGNPGFYIKSNSPNLESYFTDFFTELGIRITPNPEEATYIVFCSGEFRAITHPIETERQGVQLSLRFTIRDAQGKESLIDIKNDPRKSACFVGNDYSRQMEICAGKAFKQMKNPLHKKIQTLIGNLVGKKMDKISSEGSEDED